MKYNTKSLFSIFSVSQWRKNTFLFILILFLFVHALFDLNINRDHMKNISWTKLNSFLCVLSILVPYATAPNIQIMYAHILSVSKKKNMNKVNKTHNMRDLSMNVCFRLILFSLLHDERDQTSQISYVFTILSIYFHQICNNTFIIFIDLLVVWWHRRKLVSCVGFSVVSFKTTF